MEPTIISVSKRRKLLVFLFYKYLLMDSSFDVIKTNLEFQKETQYLDNDSFQIGLEILDNCQEIMVIIEENLNSAWSLSRIPFLIQAILLVGVFEIKYTQTPKAVTINEMVKITKEFDATFDHKFINALLDKIIKL